MRRVCVCVCVCVWWRRVNFIRECLLYTSLLYVITYTVNNCSIRVCRLYTKLRIYKAPLIRRSAYTNLRSTQDPYCWLEKSFQHTTTNFCMLANIAPITKGSFTHPVSQANFSFSQPLPKKNFLFLKKCISLMLNKVILNSNVFFHYSKHSVQSRFHIQRFFSF
jgi:hypothetical protein